VYPFLKEGLLLWERGLLVPRLNRVSPGPFMDGIHPLPLHTALCRVTVLACAEPVLVAGGRLPVVADIATQGIAEVVVPLLLFRHDGFPFSARAEHREVGSQIGLCAKADTEVEMSGIFNRKHRRLSYGAKDHQPGRMLLDVGLQRLQIVGC